MNLQDEKYSRYKLVTEMLETAKVIRNLDIDAISHFSITHDSVLITGEGSSRIFPAKNCIYTSLIKGYPVTIRTENATQAREYDLSAYSVFVASNSGKTAEGVRLIRHLKEKGHDDITGIVAHANTPIMNESDNHWLLTCGNEEAVAATKSVMEQALFYDLFFRSVHGATLGQLDRLADAIEETLTLEVPEAIVEALASSSLIYFSGRNNGVAEELRLKTNEITRKKSDYLEGTYAVHGIEEVMQEGETLVIIDPFPEEEEKIQKVLVEGTGISVVAVASRETSFPTFTIPSLDGFDTYLQLAAGWNLLVETGIATGIDLDKPQRARKVGNEFSG